MRVRTLTTAELILVAGTRAMLGGGIGLVVAGYLSDTVRLAVGWTLTVVGALLTIPIAMDVFGKK